jgi:hypothetical protein
MSEWFQVLDLEGGGWIITLAYFGFRSSHSSRQPLAATKIKRWSANYHHHGKSPASRWQWTGERRVCRFRSPRGSRTRHLKCRPPRSLPGVGRRVFKCWVLGSAIYFPASFFIPWYSLHASCRTSVYILIEYCR